MISVGQKTGKIRPFRFVASRIGIGKVVTGNVNRLFGRFHSGAGSMNGRFETEPHVFLMRK